MKPGLRFNFYRPQEARAVADWVSARIPGSGSFWPCVGMGVFRGPEQVGGVVFYNYDPEAGVMEMSAAGVSWLNRSVLHAMHEYIFDTAGCQLAVLRVSERNKRMLRIAEAYGYRKHLIPRMGGRDEAQAIMTLTDDDWRDSRFHKKR